MSRRAARLAIVATLGGVLAACPRASPQVEPAGPDEAYRRFAAAVRTGDADTAWSLVDEAGRRRLSEAASEVAKVRGLPAPKDGRWLLLESGGRAPAKVREASVRDVAGERAVVTVTDEHGGWRDVPMTREGAAWKVAVAAMLPER